MNLDHVQIAIPIGGESEVRAFYGELLGLAELLKPEPLRSRGGCWFQLGDRQLHLGVEVDFTPARKAHIAVAVECLADLRAKLAAAGNDIVEDTSIEGRDRFFTNDPFGNRIEFVQAAASD